MKMKIQRASIWLWFITFLVFLIAAWIFYNLYTSVQPGAEYVYNTWSLAIAFCLASLQQLLTPLFSLLALRSVGQITQYVPMLWITMLSTSANSTVPFPAGLPIRAVLQKKILKISYTTSSSAIVIETITSYGYLIIAVIITGVLWLGPVLKQRISVFKGPLFFVLILIGICLSLVLIYLIARRINGNLVEYLRNAGRLILKVKPKPLLVMSLLTVVSFVLSILRFSMVLYSVGIRISPGPLFSALVFAHLAGVISFVPMGLGVRDVSLASLLVMLGVPVEHAAAAAAFDRVLITVPILVGGIIATRIIGGEIAEVMHTNKNQSA